LARDCILLFLFSLFLLRPPPKSTLFPYTTLFRSEGAVVFFMMMTFAIIGFVELFLVRQLSRVLGTGVRRETEQHQQPLFQPAVRSEEHTSELQSRGHLVCRLLLEKKKDYF